MGGRKRSFKQEPASKDISWWKRLYRWTGYQRKTLWDWQALLFVPVSIALIASLITLYQTTRQQEIENKRAQSELEIEEQRAQDTALQAYFDHMSELMLDRGLRTSEEGDTVRLLARARTITILRRLDSGNNSDILQFLHEAQLISGTDPVVRLDRSNLSGADLSRVDLSGVDLSEAGLSEADLSGADLSGANLNRADLIGASLFGAHLMYTDLRKAHLKYDDLSEADLSWAILNGADLSGTYMKDADLSKAYLNGADLSNARGVTKEQLEEQTKKLKGATMPDGSKHS
jgi:uncharacterized protein YjbI with pentapeptide repeats